MLYIQSGQEFLANSTYSVNGNYYYYYLLLNVYAGLELNASHLKKFPVL